MLVVTSDLPEALRIADRLLVVRGGTTTVEFGPDATQVDVLAAAAGDAERGGDAAMSADDDARLSTTGPRPRPGGRAERRNRILPAPVTGQELVLIGVIAVIWVVLALRDPGVPHRAARSSRCWWPRRRSR